MDVIRILWLRQMRRYVRSRSRIVGAFGQPILMMIALGYGIGAIYSRAGEGNYLQFLVPGIVTQTILLSAVFWGVIILQDKRFGFLAELLVTPVTRLRILLGSALGGATIAMLQGILILAIGFLFGFRPHDWLLVVPGLFIMGLMTLALTCFGAGIASMVEDFQGFQGINNFLVMPLFFLSSALYPLTDIPAVLRFLTTINPVTYMVDALRVVLTNQGHFSLETDLLVITVTLVISVVFAVNRFNRIEM
ncbi:MAG TPA: ABC transporter permease [Candidatus Saccharimonadales bacterium]|nr:ABC transporter permease [Candidatus Saccharimonadales bacterium]